jgi:hypothetical protein
MSRMLDVAINRFGGDALWQRLHSVTLDIQSIGGPLPTIKGIGRTFPHFGRVKIHPKQFRAVFYDREGTLLGDFESGKVHHGDFTTPDNYRSTFNGIAKHRSWTTQDAMYFFGYALTIYLSIPFLLRNLPIRTQPWRDGGFRVDAVFPQQLHSHCREQSFYFDQGGLLVRHDYTADIVSRFASGAHFTSDYKEIDGLPIACQRRVFARLGGVVTPIPVLSATIRPVEVGFVEI